jgi:CheY-like chemotaxis protein
LLSALMKLLRRLLPESIAIVSLLGEDLSATCADPAQLEQVIVNLCVNARDAMEGGGQLTIETENIRIDESQCETSPGAKPGNYVLLSVKDTGTGMAVDVRERAFEPFFTTKGAQQGTGLGLSIVYGIVQQHGGMIQVHSELGEGTTFRVILPADTRQARDAGNKLRATSPRGQETILLAEDDERVRRVVVQILERAGYRTIVAVDGLDAIRLLGEAEESVHLVLLDVVMPGLGGPEAWERIKSLRPGLSVLFTSGYADDRYLARLPPDADVVGKPFRAEELLSRIRKKLDEGT